MRSEVSGVRTITGLKPQTSCGCWRLKVSTKCSQHSASSPSWKFKDLLNTLLWTREQSFKHGPSTWHYHEISLPPSKSYHLPAARLLASCPLSQTRKNPRISLEPHDQAEAEARLVEPGHCGHHGAQLGSATRRLNELRFTLQSTRNNNPGSTNYGSNFEDACNQRKKNTNNQPKESENKPLTDLFEPQHQKHIAHDLILNNAWRNPTIAWLSFVTENGK